MNVLRKPSRCLLRLWSFSKSTKRIAGSGGACESMDDGPIKERLLVPVAENPTVGTNKVTVIGAGAVGVACAFGLLARNVTNEVCLVNRTLKKAQAEVSDMQHGSSYINDARITASDEYSATANSVVGIITVGVPFKKGTVNRLSVMKPNTELIKTIVPKFLKYSPDSTLVIITNPVDVMTYVAWKVSGLPKNRVIGTGASLDSSRFQFILSELLGVPPSACNGYVIGEHGASCVPVWSGVTAAGVRLRDIDPQIGIRKDKEGFHKVHRRVITAGAKVMKGKGNTCWGIALNCTAITKAIIENTSEVISVSTSVKGLYDFDKDIFLSLPCTINANGVTAVIKVNLTELELTQLRKSADILYKLQLKTNV